MMLKVAFFFFSCLFHRTFIQAKQWNKTGSTTTKTTIFVTGHPVDVWSSVETYHRCGDGHGIDVPDIPPRFYVSSNNTVFMIDGSTKTYPMNGSSIFNLTRGCSLVWNMTGNPDPAMFAGNEFLDSTIVFPNGTVISLVHTEFPGGGYGNCTAGLRYPYCWTVTIGLAISHDWGMTWEHARPPPHHLVAAVPYGYNETLLAYGWGDPSNIVRHPIDGYYYVAMWNRHEVGLQKPGTCIARTNNLMDPNSWRGWDGNAYTTTFVSPYDMKPNAPKERHVCVVLNIPPSCATFSIVWSEYLQLFVAVMGCSENAAMPKAFSMTTSKDLITWSSRQDIYSKSDIPADVMETVTSIGYPSLIDLSAPSLYGDMNFYTVGQEPFLMWVSLGHNVYTDGRHVWATPIKFTTEGSESMIE